MDKYKRVRLNAYYLLFLVFLVLLFFNVKGCTACKKKHNKNRTKIHNFMNFEQEFVRRINFIESNYGR